RSAGTKGISLQAYIVGLYMAALSSENVNTIMLHFSEKVP
ncbi:MAG: hypothetical protein ACI9AX_001062, partial [Polaromonas sp.]